MFRSKDEINKIKQHESPPFVIENVVDVKAFLQYYAENKNKVIKKNTGPQVLTIPPKDNFLFYNLEIILKKYVGEFKVRNAHFFETEVPHVIHNDDIFEDSKPYKAFTIPLKIFGSLDDIKLILFDQYFYHGPAKFFNGETSEREVFYNKSVTNYENLSYTNNKGIDKEFQEKYLTHCKTKWLEGLSINTVLDWTVGNILCFDSLQLHCSSDFTKQGVSKKIGLSVFTVKE
jgi:hypothetical protein